MLAFLGRRLAMLVATLLVASFAIYGALYLAPGSPIAALTGGRSVPPEVLAQLEERYHLNEPFLTRYWLWLTSALHGDLGESIPLHEQVSTLISQRIGVTISLVLLTSVIIIVVGVGLGIVGALGRGTVDTGVLFASTVSAAMPAFAAAVILQFVALKHHLRVSRAPPPHPARDRAGGHVGRTRDPGDSYRSPRGAPARARPDGDQPRPAVVGDRAAACAA